MAIGRIDGGLAIETADSALKDVIAAVQRSGKKGSVTITLDVAPNGGLTLPDRLTIRAPIYQGMQPQPIAFLLRYRIQDAALRFQIEMHDRQEVLKEAFERCVDAVVHDLKPQPTIYWIE